MLAASDIKLLLIIDICTFFFTVVTTGIVKRGLAAKSAEVREGFIESFRGGWKAITGKRGVIILIMASAVLTCFMGIFQILAEPLLLDFTSSTILGIAETICACGMLLSSLLLGFRGIKKAYVKVLCLSLFLAGIAMAVFGLKENIYLIGTAGFCFFAMLPFANSCLDYLVRTNIAGEMQGRAWGLIGFLSQIGYVIAYGTAGFLADAFAKGLQIGVGRGAAAVIILSGILLAAASAVLYMIRSVKELECDDNNAGKK